MHWVKIFDDLDNANRAIPDGSSRLVIIGERRICLSQFNQTFRASDDKCPHLGDELHKGKINFMGEVVCPWHSYTFNMVTGEESSRRCDDLRIYPVKADEEGLSVGIP